MSKKVVQTKKRFSLKDELFNAPKVEKLAEEIKAVCPDFNKHLFTQEILSRFPEEELMERIRTIVQALRTHLPNEYPQALRVILAALPAELDPKKTDNDFGDFIYAPYSYFVATYGCSEKHVARSLEAFKEITKRFSAEGALRDFINAFPKETLAAVEEWSKDSNYHVRRLASEGTRPLLPWAKKITIKPTKMTPVLDRLHSDTTRYVTRSVANHLNDIAKLEPDVVVQTLQKWQKAAKQDSKELAFITKHSLRTLVKQGHQGALRLLGYGSSAVAVKKFTASKNVTIGSDLELTFELLSINTSEQSLMIDYVIHFLKANGKTAPKVFKISTTSIKGGETMLIEKRHPLRIMSTRALYPGLHEVELQINGKSFGKQKFILK